MIAETAVATIAITNDDLYPKISYYRHKFQEKLLNSKAFKMQLEQLFIEAIIS